MNPNLPVNSTMVGKDGAPLPMWYRFFSNASKLLVALTQSGTTAQRPTSFLWIGRPYFNRTLVMVEFWDGAVWVSPGAGGGAPTSATYVTLSTNATLTAERTAAVTSPITLTDGGANNPVTWAFDQTVVLGNNARVAVNKNSGATVGTRRRINFIEGSNITLTIADDAGSEEVDVTINASGSGAASSGVGLLFEAEQGEEGQRGAPGLQGVTGAQGIAGPAIWLLANDGEDGDVGMPGRQGADGVAGAPGTTGAQGPMGPAVFLDAEMPDDPLFFPGPQGPQGPAGGGGGSFTATRVSVTVPYPAQRSATVNVVDAAITATSKILVSLAGSATTAENDSDTIDLLGLMALAKAGSMDVTFNFLVPHGGPIAINYAVAA